eukprot:CAMPEP_0194217286 /NCGR_PEP_ID=MMETSP0156-20130528/20900_1 /TAXON_ID=33649 /ORGANISM="Thalassionema nitzschioides, Strain L26-B" /LENGTH=70 /DNA_ID=CAMNT_0038946293 /DNA_START=85 /DNA_END=297 /DNA_ORIENTATION=-
MTPGRDVKLYSNPEYFSEALSCAAGPYPAALKDCNPMVPINKICAWKASSSYRFWDKYPKHNAGPKAATD